MPKDLIKVIYNLRDSAPIKRYLVELGLLGKIFMVSKRQEYRESMACQHRIWRVERRHGYLGDAQAHVVSRERYDVFGASGRIVLAPLVFSDVISVATMETVYSILGLFLQSFQKRFP